MSTRGINQAVLGLLQNDAPLQALLPDGIWWDLAPQGKTRFGIVTLYDHEDTGGLDDRDLYERLWYLIKATIRGADPDPALDAAERIHAILHRANLDLTAAGYTCMACLRERYHHVTEPDPVDKTIRWHWAGGRYVMYASSPS
jgi:hypothetical protein